MVIYKGYSVRNIVTDEIRAPGMPVYLRGNFFGRWGHPIKKTDNKSRSLGITICEYNRSENTWTYTERKMEGLFVRKKTDQNKTIVEVVPWVIGDESETSVRLTEAEESILYQAYLEPK